MKINTKNIDNEVRLYPNQGNLNFRIASTQPLAGTLFIYNQLGVAAKQYYLSNNTEFIIETHNIPPGVYTVMIQTEKNMRVLGEIIKDKLKFRGFSFGR